MEGAVEARGESVRCLNGLPALSPHSWGDPDAREIGNENVGAALTCQIGHDAPDGGGGGLDQRLCARVSNSSQQKCQKQSASAFTISARSEAITCDS